MQSILIVEPSEILRGELERELKKLYQICCCENGDEGLRLLSEHHPAGLILNLNLPGTDGLFLLEHMEPPRPKAIITLSSSYPTYVLQQLKDLGVDYPMLIPCRLRAVTHRIRSILEEAGAAKPPDAQEITAAHLQRLGVPRWGGYEDLRVGVPLFAQDPGQRMVKEFYAAVAALRGRDNWQQVERAIREAKEQAYRRRDEQVWKAYFPDLSGCPTNKEFIARLAEFLK